MSRHAKTSQRCFTSNDADTAKAVKLNIRVLPAVKVERLLGMVKSFSTGSGFGFIECEEVQRRYRRDAFLHRAQAGEVTVGNVVEFSVDVNEKGMPQARDVKVVDENRSQEYKQREFERLQVHNVEGIINDDDDGSDLSTPTPDVDEDSLDSFRDSSSSVPSQQASSTAAAPEVQSLQQQLLNLQLASLSMNPLLLHQQQMQQLHQQAQLQQMQQLQQLYWQQQVSGLLQHAALPMPAHAVQPAQPVRTSQTMTAVQAAQPSMIPLLPVPVLSQWTTI
ncbi:hypothetical protein DIPPA_11524 [Diplonema papillatum]|nr:hypothetical protein DIPPA_11524 [Diplonema papillatum]